MHDRNYRTMNFATLGQSWLLPPFTSTSMIHSLNLLHSLAPGKCQSFYLFFQICKDLCSYYTVILAHYVPLIFLLDRILPKLPRHFVEFLYHNSLHIFIHLYLPTCVGFRYGPLSLYSLLFLNLSDCPAISLYSLYPPFGIYLETALFTFCFTLYSCHHFGFRWISLLLIFSRYSCPHSHFYSPPLLSQLTLLS